MQRLRFNPKTEKKNIVDNNPNLTRSPEKSKRRHARVLSRDTLDLPIFHKQGSLRRSLGIDDDIEQINKLGLSKSKRKKKSSDER